MVIHNLDQRLAAYYFSKAITVAGKKCKQEYDDHIPTYTYKVEGGYEFICMFVYKSAGLIDTITITCLQLPMTLTVEYSAFLGTIFCEDADETLIKLKLLWP